MLSRLDDQRRMRSYDILKMKTTSSPVKPPDMDVTSQWPLFSEGGRLSSYLPACGEVGAGSGRKQPSGNLGLS